MKFVVLEMSFQVLPDSREEVVVEVEVEVVEEEEEEGENLKEAECFRRDE
jgi:hypothetical protein